MASNILLKTPVINTIQSKDLVRSNTNAMELRRMTSLYHFDYKFGFGIYAGVAFTRVYATVQNNIIDLWRNNG